MCGHMIRHMQTLAVLMIAECRVVELVSYPHDSKCSRKCPIKSCSHVLLQVDRWDRHIVLHMIEAEDRMPLLVRRSG